MANLGTIGKTGLINVVVSSVFALGNAANRRIVIGDVEYLCAVRDDVIGSSTPSLRIDTYTVYRFRWAVATGSRTLTVDLKQTINASPRPTVVVRANAAIGVAADVSATAGSSTGFIATGPITITPSSDGAVWVEITNLYSLSMATMNQNPLYIDNIVVT